MERPTTHSTPPAARRLALALRAGVLVATLVVGAAFHLLHHLQDPACGSGPDPSSHVCVACAGLHASTLVAAETHAPEPRAIAWSPFATALHARAASAPRGSAAPRAPPA